MIKGNLCGIVNLLQAFAAQQSTNVGLKNRLHLQMLKWSSQLIERIRNKERPLGETSGHGTESHVESGRGIAVIFTRGWGPVSSTRVLAVQSATNARTL